MRKFKVIADVSVDMAFGTGAVGVTPAHSHVDYEMAQKESEEVLKRQPENYQAMLI